MLIQWVDLDTWQWIDSTTNEWDTSFSGTLSSPIYSLIFNDGTYAYSSYDNVLDIYNVATQVKLTSLHYSYYITSIFVNDNSIFWGAKDEGVYALNKNVLSNFYNNDALYNATYLYKESFDITSNYINFIHGNNDYISFCTTSGVDFFKFEPNGYRSYTTCSGANKCFLLTERELFYTVSGTSGYYICKVDPISNWVTTDNFIPSGSALLALVDDITDFKITKNSLDEIIIFIITNIGIGVLNYNKNEVTYLNNLLPDVVTNIISIDIDEATTDTSGYLYVTMKNHFVVINLTTMAITDMYTKGVAGKSLETLDYEDIEKSDIS